jgi:tetratricopeptide (TPR) repeat protein
VDIDRLGGDDELEQVRQMHLGSVLSANGRHDEAVPHFEAALALAEKKFGHDAPRLGNVVEALAAGLTRAHRNEEALAAYRRALPLSEKNFGAHHPSVARLLSNMSAALMDLGHLEEAAAASRRALEIIEASDKDSYIYGSTANNLGDCLRMMKKPAEAEAEYRKAVAFHLRNQPDTYEAGDSMTGIGGSLTDQGKPREAIPFLERAFKLLEAAKGPAESLASTQIELARALWDAGREHPRAVSLAKAAQTTFIATHYEADAKRASDWLSEHK